MGGKEGEERGMSAVNGLSLSYLLAYLVLLSCRSSVDKDQDYKINKTEFCIAMAMIRQAQAQQGSFLNSSLPASAVSAGLTLRYLTYVTFVPLIDNVHTVTKIEH